METKKHYLKKSGRRYVFIFWSIMAAVMSLFLVPLAIAINNIGNNNLGWAIIGAMYFMLILNIPSTILNIFIVISDKGIRYKMYVRTITTKWENAKGFVKDTNSWIFKNQEGLLFSTGEIEEKPKNLIFRPMQLPMAFIPLSWFSDDWQKSEIMNEIKQYAPNLF